MKKRELIYILFFVYLLFFIGFIFSYPNEKSLGNNLILKEKEIILQLRLKESLKKMISNFGMDLYKFDFPLEIPALSDNFINKYPKIALKYVVLLHLADRNLNSSEILNKLKVNLPQISIIIEKLFNDNSLSGDKFSENLILSNFKEDWYKQHLLNIYYKKINDHVKHSEISNKINNSNSIFLFSLLGISILTFGFIILGLIFIIFWIIHWKRDILVIPSFSFSTVENPVINTSGFFIIWISVFITSGHFIKSISSNINEEWMLKISFIHYIFISFFGIFLFSNIFLSNKLSNLKDFIYNIFNFKLKYIFTGFNGFFIAFFVMLIVTLFNRLFFKDTYLDSNPIFNYLLVENKLDIILIFILSIIIAPIFEEIIFRGVLFRVLQTKLGFMHAALISSILFGLVHFNILTFFPIATLGFILAWTYQKSNSIISPIITHALWNSFSLIKVILLYI
ncbi:MAG: CPBP family intramembrane metalloprotease [Spirochaetota bacterium]|nr:CPBP family intramembrane metalloprotease [Spirochaetota bacterium]